MFDQKPHLHLSISTSPLLSSPSQFDLLSSLLLSSGITSILSSGTTTALNSLQPFTNYSIQVAGKILFIKLILRNLGKVFFYQIYTLARCFYQIYTLARCWPTPLLVMVSSPHPSLVPQNLTVDSHHHHHCHHCHHCYST